MPKSKKVENKMPASKARKRAASHSGEGRKKRSVENLSTNGTERMTASPNELQATSVEGSADSISVGSANEIALSIRGDIDFTVSQIQRQSDWLASATSGISNIEVMKARLDILTTAWGKFEARSRDLQQSSRNETQIADDIAMQQKVEDIYVRVRAELCQKIKALEPTSSTVACSHTNNRTLQLQFAELPLADRLPTFRGAHKEWIQFRDVFAAEVIQNPHLTNLQRLRRLQSCVKEDAAKAMGYWPQREESFVDAWKTLCLAFDNEYLCHAAHCSAIFSLPMWPRATHSLIRDMLDTTRNSLRMISRQLGAEEQRDLLILNFLESRLDNTSRSQWEMVRPIDRIPNLRNDFYNWLERRSSGLLSHAMLPSSNHIDKRTTNQPITQRIKPNVSLTPNYNPCFNCSGDHAFHRCPAVQRMNREERGKRIFELGLCQNCLRRGHTARNCLARRCPRCARLPHNSIICPKLESNLEKGAPRALTLAAVIDEETRDEQ
ncbi:uncharacterized protein [Eurosta solidaginis]|uniref:uncharacterized protein isoform X2 n=1 Tax=Eurosta solidaginis TaxID=178769 RepID=UPI003530FFBE